MFVTAVFFLFLLKLKWPKNKNIYNNVVSSEWQSIGFDLMVIIHDFHLVLGQHPKSFHFPYETKMFKGQGFVHSGDDIGSARNLPFSVV